MDFKNCMLCFVIGGFLALAMLAGEAHSQQDCAFGKGNTPCDYSAHVSYAPGIGDSTSTDNSDSSPPVDDTVHTAAPVFAAAWPMLPGESYRNIAWRAELIGGAAREGLMTTAQAEKLLLELEGELERRESAAAKMRGAINWWWNNSTVLFISIIAFACLLTWIASAIEKRHSEHQRMRAVVREGFEGPAEVDTLQGTVLVMASCAYCGTGDISGNRCRCCGAPNPNIKRPVSNPEEEESRPASGWNRPIPVG